MALTYTKNRWVNGDGLTVYFPDAAATPTRGGEFEHDGWHISEVYCTLADLPVMSSDSNGLLLADNVRIPAGAFIDRVETFVTKETAGANANFNLGLVKASDYSIIDADGLLAAADDFNSGTDLGGYTVFNRTGGAASTEAGALVGTRLAYTSLLCGSYDTAAFSAGILRIRVHWSVALSTDV